jgi:uncharacterized metal-binding protein
MPDGTTHSLATLLLAGTVGLGSYHLHLLDQPHAIAMAGGCLAGLLLTPDLDVDTGSDSDDWIRRLFGRGPAIVWWILWRPYSYLIPHRSPLSHFPIVGTVIRLGYVSLIAWVTVWLLDLLVTLQIPAIRSIPWWFPLGFTGLALADLGHWILDNTIKGQQRRFSNNGYHR